MLTETRRVAELRFQPHQFAGTSKHNKDHSFGARGLASYDDFQKMHTEKGPAQRSAKWVPAWTRDDSKLRKILTIRFGRYEKDFRKMNLTDSKRMTITQFEIRLRHAEGITYAGGYDAQQAAVAYRSWRLGWNSKVVGESLGISDVAVRQHLFRMRQHARALGFETDEPRHWTTGSKWKRQRRMKIRLRPRVTESARRAA